MSKGLNVKKGDTVVVISGKDKGTQGKVLHVFPADSRVLVENVNMVSKHRKPRSQTQPGGIIRQENPVNVSNVMVVCPSCAKPTRIGHKEQDGRSVRVCRKCGHTL